MPQILLPLETSLRMTIAILERDLAQMQARLLQVTAEHQHQTSVTALLMQAGILLPVPLSACTFDAQQGVLRFEATEPEAGVPAEA